VSPDDIVRIDIFGEGRADVGQDDRLREPTGGVVPILVHRLCGKPATMRVKCYKQVHLERIEPQFRSGYEQKAERFRKLARQNKARGAVFVVDSDGKVDERRAQLVAGRDAGPSEPPMAVGVAHPCVEAWLLADATAVRRGMGLPRTPNVPDQPEQLPPEKQRPDHPKKVLAKAAGTRGPDLSAPKKDKIAKAMNDPALVRQRCPLGFAPFADEVEEHIHPLF